LPVGGWVGEAVVDDAGDDVDLVVVVLLLELVVSDGGFSPPQPAIPTTTAMLTAPIATCRLMAPLLLSSPIPIHHIYAVEPVAAFLL